MYLERTGNAVRSQVGLLLKIPCLNGHRFLLRFAARAMSRNKICKQDFYMDTLFKFVRGSQVKNRLNTRAFFNPIDSSRFRRRCSDLGII